jgi:hypothetical protein
MIELPAQPTGIGILDFAGKDFIADGENFHGNQLGHRGLLIRGLPEGESPRGNLDVFAKPQPMITGFPGLFQ